MEELIRSYFRLINEDKFDEFFALFDPDAELSAPFGFKAKGIEKIKPFYLPVPDNFPEHEDIPAKIIISGNNAAVFINFIGKKKDGTPVSFNAMDWFVIENGKIKSLNIFFDSYTTAKL